MWHVICCEGWTFSLALMLSDLWYFEALEEKYDSINYWMNESVTKVFVEQLWLNQVCNKYRLLVLVIGAIFVIHILLDLGKCIIQKKFWLFYILLSKGNTNIKGLWKQKTKQVSFFFTCVLLPYCCPPWGEGGPGRRGLPACPPGRRAGRAGRRQSSGTGSAGTPGGRNINRTWDT